MDTWNIWDKRKAALNKNILRKKLHNFVKEKLETDLECKVRIINGTADHIHILFLLAPNFSIKDIFKNIKGSSSHWINQNDFIKQKFAWQTGYGAFSVSESKLKDVENYIRNQKEHHKKISYEEEVELFMKKYGLKFTNR